VVVASTVLKVLLDAPDAATGLSQARERTALLAGAVKEL
jgi:hypothetical protein